MGKSILWKLKYVFLGAFAAQAAKFSSQSAIAFFLSPEKFGIFQLFFIVQTYMSNCNLGALNALNRNIPFYLSRGDRQFVEDIKVNSLRFSCIASMFVAFGAMFFVLSNTSSWQSVLLFNIGILLFQEVYLYHEFIFKAEQLFRKLAKLQLFFAINLVFFSILLCLFFNLNGVYFAYLLTFINCMIFAVLLQKSIPKGLDFWRVDFKIVKELISVGFPIMLVGFIYNIALTNDRFIILYFYGSKELGYYSLMSLINGFMQFIAATATTVIYPDIMSRLGQKSTYLDIFKRLAKFQIVAFLIFVCLYICMACVVPLLVRNYYIQYLPFLDFYKILLIGVILLNMNYFNGVFFNATKTQHVFLIIQILSIILSFGANFFLCKYYNFGLTGVSCVFAIFAFLNYGCSFLYSYFFAFRNRNFIQQS